MDDGALVQIVDAATAEAARRSAGWIACRVGCTECCMGAFAISLADAGRLREGLARLDRERASLVRARARQAVDRHAGAFPGDPANGLLPPDVDSDPRFEDYAPDEPCPALDAATGACDLYDARPLACRAFGPAVRGPSGAVAACELCYQGATDAEIDACAVDLDIDALEGAGDRTTVAYALL